MDFIADNQSGIDKIPQLKILVVDDDILNQRMMQLLLMREGHQVDLASNGLEAFDAVKFQEYDVVFMDLQMPLMDGIESSRRIREWENGGRHTFIVALTASYLPEQGHILFDAGIDNYVSKPFEIEHIQQLLNYGFKARLTEKSEQKLSSGKVLDTEKGILQMGGDIEMYSELLRDFAEGLPERLQKLQQLLIQRDLAGLARAAHNLSGIAANLGASLLFDCARKLDRQSLEGYTDSLDHSLQEIQLAVANFLEIANDFLAEKKIKFASV